ncbi:hypothetical protein BpHYR1_032444 [Brachionus plicatilis]|uniref:Uncharacterized protein n=1 Tax=Brachionus plicatilis TaxID=10195 RepID=A0A3M7PLR1_BRAPC|nr:hypothetical protein BpHYR1_032444 [Brachionus plicatilis]
MKSRKNQLKRNLSSKNNIINDLKGDFLVLNRLNKDWKYIICSGTAVSSMLTKLTETDDD